MNRRAVENETKQQPDLNIVITEEIRTPNNKSIKNAELTVFHGTEQAAGTKGVSIKVTLTDGTQVEAGSYRLEGTKFFYLNGKPVIDVNGLNDNPLFYHLEAHLQTQPQDLQKLYNKLNPGSV